MESSKTDSNARGYKATLWCTLAMGLWVIGGFVAMMTVNWSSYSLTTRGHILTAWLMVAFGLMAGVYISFLWAGRLRKTAWVIVFLLLVIEVILVKAYFSW